MNAGYPHIYYMNRAICRESGKAMYRNALVSLDPLTEIKLAGVAIPSASANMTSSKGLPHAHVTVIKSEDVKETKCREVCDLSCACNSACQWCPFMRSGVCGKVRFIFHFSM